MKKYNNSEESLKSHDSRDHVMIHFIYFFCAFFFFILPSSSFSFFFEFQLRNYSREQISYAMRPNRSRLYWHWRVSRRRCSPFRVSSLSALSYPFPFSPPYASTLANGQIHHTNRQTKVSCWLTLSLIHTHSHSLSHLLFVSSSCTFIFRAIVEPIGKIGEQKEKKRKKNEVQLMFAKCSASVTCHTHSLRSLHNTIQCSFNRYNP